MTQIVFAHGWGSGTFVWDKMRTAFEGHDIYMINMGFVGDEKMEVPDGQFIGIGHSLGGLWLMKHYSDQMIGFISIASFNCFHNHIPHQILNMMKRNMVKDSTKQLLDFWHHAGLDQPNGFKDSHPAKLIEGLGWLSKWEADIPAIPIKVLAARDDHIVPKKMTHDIWQDYDIEWREDGGHMLPLTQSEWCIQQTKEFINAL